MALERVDVTGEWGALGGERLGGLFILNLVISISHAFGHALKPLIYSFIRALRKLEFTPC